MLDTPIDTPQQKHYCTGKKTPGGAGTHTIGKETARQRYAHINAGHVPDFIRFGVKPHCYDELKCYTPSTRPRYKYKFNKYRVPLFSAGMCPVCRCPGSPAPPQYPSGALYGSRRPRPRPPRAPPRGRCPAHSSTPRCRRSPPCRRSRRPICMHCSVTIERTCIKQLPAAATRFSWSLDMRGGISPSWLEVLLCRRSPPRRRSRTHAYLSAHA